jgi:hypothetical protein
MADQEQIIPRGVCVYTAWREADRHFLDKLEHATLFNSTATKIFKMNSEQHRKCQQRMNSAMKDSPSVVFMLEQLEKVGCKFNSSNFKCIPCVDSFTGGFAPDYGVYTY